MIVPVSYSITHTHAVKNAATAGARIIVMTDFTPEVMMHGGIEADFDQIKPTCIAVAKALETAEEIHITSPGELIFVSIRKEDAEMRFTA